MDQSAFWQSISVSGWINPSDSIFTPVKRPICPIARIESETSAKNLALEWAGKESSRERQVSVIWRRDSRRRRQRARAAAIATRSPLPVGSAAMIVLHCSRQRTDIDAASGPTISATGRVQKIA